MKQTLRFRKNLKQWRNQLCGIVFIGISLLLACVAFWLAGLAPDSIKAVSDNDGVAYAQSIAIRALSFILAVAAGGIFSFYLIFARRIGMVGVVAELDERISKLEEDGNRA